MLTKEVSLKDGRKIKVRELSALEDVLAYRMVGKDFDEENKFGGGVTARSLQIALSVIEISGEKVSTLKNLEESFQFMAKFSKRDWAKISEAYYELNEADDEGE